MSASVRHQRLQRRSKRKRTRISVNKMRISLEKAKNGESATKCNVFIIIMIIIVVVVVIVQLRTRHYRLAATTICVCGKVGKITQQHFSSSSSFFWFSRNESECINASCAFSHHFGKFGLLVSISEKLKTIYRRLWKVSVNDFENKFRLLLYQKISHELNPIDETIYLNLW